MFQQAKHKVEELVNGIMKSGELPTAHPVVQDLVAAARSANVDAYRRALRSFSDVVKQQRRANRCLELYGRLTEVAPQFAEKLRHREVREQLHGKLATWQDAWAFHRAKTWLRQYADDHHNDDQLDHRKRRLGKTL